MIYGIGKSSIRMNCSSAFFLGIITLVYRMKIGFFTDGYLPQVNGVAVSVAACARALEKRGHEVYIIAPSYPRYKDKKRVIRINSITYPENPEIRLATFLPGKSLLSASRVDFDIVHGHSGGPVTLLGWEVAKLKRVPFVVTYHTLWNQYTHYILKGRVIKPKMAEVASKIFGNLCDTLIVPTKKVRSELVSYGIDKPIEVIPNGIQLDAFLTAKQGWLRKKYHIPENKHILLYVGRMAKEKSIDYLIRSFSEVHKKDKDSILVLVGDGPETSHLKELATRSGVEDSVIFTGYVDQKKIPLVYADADIFVFASQSETQGMVILEAFASGTPVVAVQDDAFTDVITNGKDGLLVKGSPRVFANAVLDLLNDTKKMEQIKDEMKKEMGIYSADKVAERLENLYKDLVTKNSKKIDFPFRNLTKYLLSHE